MSVLHMVFPFSVAAVPAADIAIPPEMERIIERLAAYSWMQAAYALGLTAAALILGRLIAALLVRCVSRWAERTRSDIDDAIMRHLARPIRWVLPVVALMGVVPLMGLPPLLHAGLMHFLLVLVIVGAGWASLKAVRIMEEIIGQKFDVSVKDNLHARTVQTQLRTFGNVARFILILLTVSFVLVTFDAVRQLGAGLLASAGVAGIVIGFAAQRSIATVLAGIQIAVTQPIRVDDVVIVEGEWGRIEEITLTYVVVKIWDLRRLVVPINYFIEKPFQNWTRVSSDILGTVFLYLDYSVPVDAVREELKRLVEDSPLWDKKVCGVQITDTTEKTMVLRALVSAHDASAAWDLRCNVREALIRFIQEKYPTALPRFKAEVENAPTTKSQ